MRLPIMTSAITMIIVALYFIAGAMPDSLIWHQSPTTQFWQWASGHFVHISLEHLIWNIGAFIILASIIEQTSRKVLSISIASGIIGVNLYLLLFFQLNAYAGLSGALNCLLVTALYFLYKQPAYKQASTITLIASLVKILIETAFDFSLFSSLPWTAVPQAHMAGFISGLVVVLFLELRLKKLMKCDLVKFTNVSASNAVKNAK